MPKQSAEQPQARYAAAGILGLWGLTLALIAGCTESPTMPSAPVPGLDTSAVRPSSSGAALDVEEAVYEVSYVPEGWTADEVAAFVEAWEDAQRPAAWRPNPFPGGGPGPRFPRPGPRPVGPDVRVVRPFPGRWSPYGQSHCTYMCKTTCWPDPDPDKPWRCTTRWTRRCTNPNS